VHPLEHQPLSSEWKLRLNGLCIILSDGERLVGIRFTHGRYFVDRKGVYDCEICGFPHIHHNPNIQYRAILVASAAHEDWIEIPDHRVWQVSMDNEINVHNLREYV
jgi:hypothetical protein